MLLHGEEAAVLTEAYYVTHKEIAAATQDTARRYFDLAVRYGDLLFAAEDVDAHASRRRERRGADRGAGAGRDRLPRPERSGDASCACEAGCSSA